MKAARIIGHEPVGVIEELGPGLTGYAIGDRVLVGAITPCGRETELFRRAPERRDDGPQTAASAPRHGGGARESSAAQTGEADAAPRTLCVRCGMGGSRNFAFVMMGAIAVHFARIA